MRSHDLASALEPREQLRVDRETVRVLRVQTGVRTGDGNTGNTTSGGTAVQAVTIR